MAEIIVKTPTRKAYDELLSLISHSRDIKDVWSTKGKHTAVRVLDGKEWLGYDSVSYYLRTGHTPMTLGEFKKRFTKAKAVEFKGGDLVIGNEDARIYTFTKPGTIWKVAYVRRGSIDVVGVEKYGTSGTFSAVDSANFDIYKEEKEQKLTRRTFKLLKETPELKKGALFQEACDDGDQEYVCISPEMFKFDDREEYFDEPETCQYSRNEVEQNPKWFVEVFPATAMYLTKEELQNFKAFISKK